jgi:hypothetical protein
MKHVMLVVKLHNASKNTEKGFRRRMKGEGWTVVENISNTYQKTFPEDEHVKSAVKDCVRRVTKQLDTTNWSAIYAGGSEEVGRIKL